MNPDPSPDIYKMLDRAGLTASDILMGKQSTAKTVVQIRVKIVEEFKKYMAGREQNIIAKAQEGEYGK